MSISWCILSTNIQLQATITSIIPWSKVRFWIFFSESSHFTSYQIRFLRLKGRHHDSFSSFFFPHFIIILLSYDSIKDILIWFLTAIEFRCLKPAEESFEQGRERLSNALLYFTLNTKFFRLLHVDIVTSSPSESLLLYMRWLREKSMS